MFSAEALEELLHVAIATAKAELATEKASYYPYPPHEKQQVFLDFEGKEAFYGGAAGGGKSDALLMAALQYVHVPGYSALLLRRTLTDLNQPRSLIPRSKEWLGGIPGISWNGTWNQWTFPSGAVIKFGYLKNPGDELQYKSAEFQFVAFDELTQFTEGQYLYLFSRLRKAKGAAIPIRMRSASNPGGIGHDWVKKRFVGDGSGDLNTPDKQFFPSLVYDNPGMDVEDYVTNLGYLDETLQAQLLRGDWDVADVFYITWDCLEGCETICLWEEGAVRNPRGELYLGVDVGRTKDLTVLWTFERIEDVLWTREILELPNTSFKQQKHEISSRLKSGRYRACRIDKGGIGYQLAEELETEFPHLVEGMQLNSATMGMLAKQFKGSMLDRSIRIPASDSLREDFRKVKRVDERGAVPVLKTERDSSGHGDMFWSATLSRHAAGNLSKTVKKTGKAFGHTFKGGVLR